jgi:hypothetical protein
MKQSIKTPFLNQKQWGLFFGVEEERIVEDRIKSKEVAQWGGIICFCTSALLLCFM